MVKALDLYDFQETDIDEKDYPEPEALQAFMRFTLSKDKEEKEEER